MAEQTEFVYQTGQKETTVLILIEHVRHCRTNRVCVSDRAEGDDSVDITCKIWQNKQSLCIRQCLNIVDISSSEPFESKILS